jgi:hypothetical protein
MRKDFQMDNFRYSPEARRLAERPVTGHKGRPHFGFRYSCECGWESGIYWGKGARGQAAHELYYHKLACVVAARETANV